MRNLEKKQAARKKALAAIDTLKARLYNQGLDKSSIEFYSIVHEYFAEYSGIRYEFTYPEIIREIRRKKVFSEFVQKKVKEFIQALQNKEFNSEALTKEELTSLLNDFRAIVLAGSQSGEPEDIRISLSARAKILMMSSIRKFGRKEVSELIKYSQACGHALSKGNLPRAQDMYLEMEAIYNKLGKKEQQAAHSQMKDSYSRIDTFHTNMILERLEKKQEEFYSHLEAGELEKAAGSYNQANDLYNELSSKGKKTIFAEMQRMHSKFKRATEKTSVTRIERLLNEARQSCKANHLAQAEWAYSKAQKDYEKLGPSQKTRVYPQIKELYKRISNASGGAV